MYLTNYMYLTTCRYLLIMHACIPFNCSYLPFNFHFHFNFLFQFSLFNVQFSMFNSQRTENSFKVYVPSSQHTQGNMVGVVYPLPWSTHCTMTFTLNIM